MRPMHDIHVRHRANDRTECTTPDINPSNVCTHLSACLARATPKANSFAYHRCRDSAAVKTQPATERAMQMYLAVGTMRQGQPFENTRHMCWNVQNTGFTLAKRVMRAA